MILPNERIKRIKKKMKSKLGACQCNFNFFDSEERGGARVGRKERVSEREREGGREGEREREREAYHVGSAHRYVFLCVVNSL